ncbi:hypothetical protein C8R45DRAFT_1131083 [Mycena sanguinolenta]|nr:hypothetical protein C8R45DRAFT_1131083 [Mycena sanguinolenta]
MERERSQGNGTEAGTRRSEGSEGRIGAAGGVEGGVIRGGESEDMGVEETDGEEVVNAGMDSRRVVANTGVGEATSTRVAQGNGRGADRSKEERKGTAEDKIPRRAKKGAKKQRRGEEGVVVEKRKERKKTDAHKAFATHPAVASPPAKTLRTELSATGASPAT